MSVTHATEFTQAYSAAVQSALSRVGQEQQQAFEQFCSLFSENLPAEDWHNRPVCDGAALLLALWELLTDSNQRERFVGLINTQVLAYGGQPRGSMILALQNDRPFLVDSLRLALTRRRLPISVLKNAVITPDRDSRGTILSLHGGGPKQSIIYIETKHLSDDEYQALWTDLMEVFDDISQMVKDYQAITAAVDGLYKQLAYAPVDADSISDAQAFLSWLKAGHFTFLGLRVFHFEQRGSGKALLEDDSARLGVFRHIAASTDGQWSEGIENFYQQNDLISFSKSSTRCRIHRLVYPDYIVTKLFDVQGQAQGEVRILGLFTYPVYTLNPWDIPLVNRKVNQVLERANFDASSYLGKQLQRVIENYPRDELFQANLDELTHTLLGVASINERRIVRLFIRFDEFARFATVVAYIPRDVYNTQLRLNIEKLLGAALHSRELDSTTAFSESILARAFMVFRLGPDSPKVVDCEALEEAVRQLARPWEEELSEAIAEQFEDASSVIESYGQAFSAAYQAGFTSQQALEHIAILQAQPNETLRLAISKNNEQTDQWTFTLFHLGNSLALSDVVPILEHLGLKVLGEHSYLVSPMQNGQKNDFYLHHFSVQILYAVERSEQEITALFVPAFKAIWQQRCDSDSFNRLILAAAMPYYAANVFRTYAVYLKQTLFFLGVEAISDALLKHVPVVVALWQLFDSRFNPTGVSEERSVHAKMAVLNYLESVTQLNDDKILRRLLELIGATLRTNLYQFQADGPKSYLSIKLATARLADIPEPKPAFEIFMFGPQVEGVHLRTSKVARGGLRWSDRLQDYRTEVLGLVKAQQVKNAVIVPSGAKGGFVPKNIPADATRDQIQTLGIAAYRTFISALLDITDNYQQQEIIRPSQVVCYDEPDPYLVVAADKGTATFSDIANGISIQYGHWLKDAFASGGSQGYDHKGMGITAKGAWVAVERHFRELGRSTFSSDFTVVGIGDMSGDVFGNGMLLSEHICLVAAFNHQHIFIDPAPDARISFVERKRLFNLPRSGWSDYDLALISSGGGVFLRSAKAIVITEPMKNCFGLTAEQLTPNELICALLQAPVDLIWNGGIGTYVKSSQQSHADIGDKANDGVRVDGQQLKCKIFGEGGNLGMSQLGRIEYCLQGGACNTDFIDNAGGVDCSDHEVNIKICLDELMTSGQLSLDARNDLMRSMTDEVAQLVLKNIERQTMALSFAANEVKSRMSEYVRFIEELEHQGRLQRRLEFLPSTKALSERSHLTRPELAVLLSYAKVMLKDVLVEPAIYNEPYLAQVASGAFPSSLQARFPDALARHRLRPQLVATQLANEMINNLGITTPQRLKDTSGANWVELAKAYTAARDVLQFEHFQQTLVDTALFPSSVQMGWFASMSRRLRRVTRWYLRTRTDLYALDQHVSAHRAGLQAVNQALRGCNAEDLPIVRAFQNRVEDLTGQGVPVDVAEILAMPEDLFSHLGIVKQAELMTGGQAAGDEQRYKMLAVSYYRLKAHLHMDGFIQALASIPISNSWQAQVRDSYLLEVENTLSQFAVVSAAHNLKEWFAPAEDLWGRWIVLIEDIEKQGLEDFAVFAVAMGLLAEIAKRVA
ncbi:MAG TPA: NAD-glutamate dehydrogenase [Cellvibrionaceae bacterium]